MEWSQGLHFIEGCLKCSKDSLGGKVLQYLSLGGRLTLINGVLDVIPTYLMSLFPIPVSVEKKFNRMRSQFLWEGKAERKKYHLVKWQELIKDKKGGGLGVKNLKPHNKSLSFKWLWRYKEG